MNLNPTNCLPILRRSLPEFEEAFNEDFLDTLDLSTWIPGEDLAEMYGRLEQEIADAVAMEDSYGQTIRNEVFSKIKTSPGAPPNAGVYQAKREDLENIHTGLLFNGGVEACDGTSVVHDTLPLTITQIGVSLVSYNGNQGAWAHRLFRRDLRSKMTDPVEEVMTVLERREKREGQALDGERLSDLARRGIMTYAERAILKDKSQALWRMGHGNLAAYELITGLWASKKERLQVSLDLINWFVEYKRFVFVPSAPRKRHWLMIGNALKPMEFAIVQTLEPDTENMLDTGHYRNEAGTRQLMKSFAHDVASKIVVGLYRVWEAAPPYLFYAHVDNTEMAAHVAMADSLLQEHRGFPMLIDLADTVCSTTFGLDTFLPSVQTVYAEQGQPFKYLGERETRSRK